MKKSPWSSLAVLLAIVAIVAWIGWMFLSARQGRALLKQGIQNTIEKPGGEPSNDPAPTKSVPEPER